MNAPLNDSTTALLRAIAGAFPGLGFTAEEVWSRHWASVTFTGARHEIAFRIEGAGAEAAAERFLSSLEAREFDLRGHIVADISLTARETGAGEVRIRLEVLTVEDS